MNPVADHPGDKAKPPSLSWPEASAFSASGAAFDHVAGHYDQDATDQPVSRWIRGQVWQRLAVLFPPGAHVLELGCGTGADALWLAARGVRVLATDASPAMLELVAEKARRAGLAHLISLRQLDLAAAARWDLPAAIFDGATSNYGPLNCIAEWRTLGSALAGAVKPGGWLGFAIMGPFCLWETAWHLLHCDWRTATRRWRGQSIATLGGVSFPVYYPSPRRFTRELGPAFTRQRLAGLGVFLPPSDLYAPLARRPRLANRLRRLEQWATTQWPLQYVGDHYWVEYRRR